MARKKEDLVRASQDATSVFFRNTAGVPETSGDTTSKQDATLDGERPQDAPEATEKPRRGRPRKKPVEASLTPENTAFGAMLKERRKAAEEGRMITVSVQDPEPEVKTVTQKVTFVEKAPTTPTSKTIVVNKETKTPTKKNRTKNSGDYLRLDMVVDGTDLKKYVGTMARVKGVSMTAYIQDLILKDMKKNDGKSFTITV